MGANNYIAGTQFGKKQMWLMYCISNGCGMVGKFDLKTRKRGNTVHGKIESTETIKIHERLNEREIIRLLSKGAIKISKVDVDREYLTYHYTPTSALQGIFQSVIQ